MHSTVKCLDLLGHRQSAGDELERHLHSVCEGLKRVIDLHGKFTSRHEHDGAGLVRCGLPALGETRDRWQPEPECLTGTGAGFAEYVATRECIGDGRRLNGKRRLHSRPGERTDKRVGKAELREGDGVVDVLAGYESTCRRTVSGIAPSAATASSVRPAAMSVTT